MKQLEKTKEKKHKNKSLLGWTFGTLILIIIVLTGFFNDIYRVTKGLVNSSILQEEAQRQEFVSRSLEATLDKLDGIAAGVMSNTMVSARHIYRNCREYIISGQFTNINFADKDGILYKTDDTTTDVSELEGYKSAMKGVSTISSPIYESVTKQMIVLYTVPVMNNDGIQGVLIGTRNASDVERELFGEKTMDHVNLIVNEKEIITFTSLASADRTYANNVWDKMLESDMEFDAVDVSKMQSNMRNNLPGKFQIGKSNYYITYTPVRAREGWTLVSLLSNEQYEDYKEKIYIISSGSTFLAILIVLIFSFYVIKQDKKNAKELWEIAMIDRLTGLGNKSAFSSMLEEVFRKKDKKKYVILLIDIHNFKLINHNYSYQQGDKILCSVANALVEITRKKEWVARQDADCFSILIEEEQFDFERIINKIKEDIGEKYGAGVVSTIHLTAGYYRIMDTSENTRDMLEKATIAWKYTKLKEKRCVEYNDTILMEQLKVKQIEDSQKNALLSGEFKVYLQPKVDLNTNKVCSAEALVRWISKELGFMAPDEFIPVVEANGFIRKIDFYVFEQVCRIIKQRLDNQERVVPVSVNQSRITILSENYIEDVTCILKKYQIPVTYLDFEVTESLFVGDYKSIIQVLTKIHELGISISMDDFGSGYSSLNLLKKMSIDNLKIDKEFLSETEKSEQSRIIIKSVIDMARELGIHVICEGVELREQVEFLQEIHCDEAQGYYYDRPVSSEEFYQKLSEGRYDDLSFQQETK